MPNIRTLFATWQTGRGLSPLTVARRTGTLRAFTVHCDPMPITSAVFTDVEEFLARFPSPRTRHAYRSDLNVFYRWAVKRHLCATNPVDDVDSVRVPKLLPRPVDPELVPLIIATADDPTLRLALGLAAYAGLRRTEITKVDAEDVSLATHRLVVRGGKGGRDRAVLVLAPLAALLRDSMPRYGRIVPWSPGQCGARISRHLHALGIDASAHQLRHTAATEAARHADLRTVADFLGHASVTTTEGYAALTRDWSGLEHMYERPDAA
jgi:integrase